MAAARSLLLPPLRSLVPKPARSPLPSGVAALDASGGIPRAALTEVCGLASSGRTSLLYSCLRVILQRGECCAFVDTQGTFDPETAKAAGMDLSRLLWVRCGGNPESALKAADLLVHAGGFGLVLLDLSGVPASLTRRIPAASWFRLRRGAEHSGTAFVVSGEQSITGSCAQLQITVQRKQVCRSRYRLSGTAVQIECAKGRYGAKASFDTIR